MPRPSFILSRPISTVRRWLHSGTCRVKAATCLVRACPAATVRNIACTAYTSDPTCLQPLVLGLSLYSTRQIRHHPRSRSFPRRHRPMVNRIACGPSLARTRPATGATSRRTGVPTHTPTLRLTGLSASSNPLLVLAVTAWTLMATRPTGVLFKVMGELT